MSDETYSTPDSEDVFQLDMVTAVPVRIEGVVETDEMPTRSAGFNTVPVPLATSTTGPNAAQLLKADPRRRSATIIAVNSDIFLGNRPGDVVGNSGAARWPAGTPLVLNTAEEVWAAAASNADTVTVIIENWAR